MAKQRRPQSRPKTDQPVAARAASAARDSSGPGEPSPTAPRVSGGSSSGTPHRSTYYEAVALYEKGLERLQQHDYSGAAEILESVLRQYPEEKELHERVQLYLNVCRRQAAPKAAAPQTLEERLYASTLALNGGRYDEALVHLRLVRDEDPDNDHALYMLAVAHAQRGELAEAVAHLERAIAINGENRGLARQDPDLEPLRGDEAFRSALESPLGPALDRRRPFRSRSAR
jgi:outer membrane protein assembly factor BamD (BamD/ComL family)